MSSVKTLVDAKIAGKKVMLFSKSYCRFSDKAKRVFKKYLGKELDPADYEVMEIEDRDDCDEMQDYLKEITGARSVPRVFIKGKCIGGGSETEALDRSGQLLPMLKA